MRKILTALAIVATGAATVATDGTPAAADGARRVWRDSGYSIGAISRNVITPYYVGYYPGHYSYYRPDPIYYRFYVSVPGCWRWSYGNRYWVC